MDTEKDDRIRQFITKDKMIPDMINKTFDDFINKVQSGEIAGEKAKNNIEPIELGDVDDAGQTNIINDKSVNINEVEKIQQNNIKSIKLNDVEQSNIIKEKISNKNEEQNSNKGIYKFKKVMTIAASIMIVFVASNVYAITQGYDNIFFMIKDLTEQKEVSKEEIFSDRAIVISYKSFKVTDEAEMQINELQIKDNKAKLYLLVKELDQNADTPFSYKVYDDTNTNLYDAISQKKSSEDIYTEVLELSNYKEDTHELRLEIYNKNGVLVKTVSIDLDKKVIEARTENVAVKKISQIELNKFLKQETEKCYTSSQLKDRDVIILEIYDIYYSDDKYVAKYLFMMPSSDDFENDKVEDSEIFLNTIEFSVDDGDYKLLNISKPESV